jgi:hypothetical protein
MKRLGPELKMPKLNGSSLKAPPFLTDVYYDLRDRRLLPLVALVAVAILAVPFLLRDSHEPASSVSLGAVESAGQQPAAGTTLRVVESTPGLRDYRKRLKRRTPADPFVQKYTSVPATSQLKNVGSGSGSSSTSGSSGGNSTLAESGGGSSSAGAPPPATAPSGGSGGEPEGSEASHGPPANQPSGQNGGGDERHYYAYRPDVRFGVAGSEDLHAYKDLPLASLLPKDNPVVIFIGATEDGSRAVFDVSSEVTTVSGNGSCVGGDQNCGLLFMRAGEAVTLPTTSGRSYRLAVDSIDFIQVERPKPASASAAEGQAIPGFSQNFSK